jgi:SH3 domain-containing YSC84-like protein 1
MKIKLILIGLALFVATLTARADQTKVDVTERMQDAAKVLNELAQAPDKGIPDQVFKSAKCVAVIPSMLKGGFIFGAKHGRGVATCRLPNGDWSAPAFFTITGGSWGLQIGVEDVQLVIMVMNEQGMRRLMEDKFQMEGSAAAAAGPVGRNASAGTDWKLDTDFLTYSRAKGLFAGIDLSGSWIERDKDSTIAMYGTDRSNTDLLTGQTAPPPEAHVFLAAVQDSELHRRENAQNR